MAVGIVDSSLKGDFVFTKNNILTFDNTGTYKLSNDVYKDSNKVFVSGDKVTVCANLIYKTIEWKVNNKLARKFENVNLLQDPNIKWVPYIILNNDTDAVELNGMSYHE